MLTSAQALAKLLAVASDLRPVEPGLPISDTNPLSYEGDGIGIYIIQDTVFFNDPDGEDAYFKLSPCRPDKRFEI